MDTTHSTYLRCEDYNKFIEEHNAFLFDCDGVLWRGPQLLPHSVDFIHRLQNLGKRVFFVTNNSTKSKQEYVEKFKGFGVELREGEDDIICASEMAARYLQAKQPHVKKAYVIGSEGLKEELRRCGIECCDEEKEDGKRVYNDLVDLGDTEVEDGVGAVVVGWDLTFNMVKLTKAHIYLTHSSTREEESKEEGSQCLFIATNTDSSLPLPGGRSGPGTGVMVRALETSTMEPIVTGKPSDWMMEFISSNYSLDMTSTVMIGDRLETDIVFGNKLGATSLFVLTGASTIDQIQSSVEIEDEKLIPNYFVEGIQTLYEGLVSLDSNN